MLNSQIYWLLATIFLLSISSQAMAQDQPSETTEASTTDSEAKAAAEVTGQKLEQKVSELETSLEDQKSEMSKLKEQMQQMADAQEAEAELEAAVAEEEIEVSRLLSIYGFFDVKFLKALVDDDSVYKGFVAHNNTFMATNANVYLASQMTEDWGALLELKFSFLPLGQINGTGTYVVADPNAPNSQVRVGEEEYDRENTTVMDPATSLRWRQGGLGIERVHLTYTPFDWLKVIAGRFLTPYGIWNVDHGSPVIIPTSFPYFMLREMVPSAQTGIQLYGRFFPKANLFLDYAITFSNGRGPIDEVYDMDENKAIGLKLKGTFEGDNMRVALGGYGYYGKYTDARYDNVLYLRGGADNPTALDTSGNTPIATREYIYSSYAEWITSADLLIEAFGVALQSEFVWRKLIYESLDAEATRQETEALFSGAPGTKRLYPANSIGWGYYFLLSYQIPKLKELIGLKVRPYVMYEENTNDDTTPFTNFDMFSVGLNMKPNGYVTLKLQYRVGIPQSDILDENIKLLSAQAAVSF